MRAKRIYQDKKGNWHIDYRWIDLLGLSVRLWFSVFLFHLIISIPVATMVWFNFRDHLPKRNNSSFRDYQQELVSFKCNSK